MTEQSSFFKRNFTAAIIQGKFWRAAEEIKYKITNLHDNGPGFQELSEELIFSRGFTTKPGGRGLGLYIAKQILNDCGFDIEASQSKFGRGAGFVIFEKETVEE